MLRFGRVLTAMVTPLDEELRPDLTRASFLAQRAVENGADGVVVAGVCEETMGLLPAERLALFRAVVEALGGRTTVIAGLGGVSTAEAVTLVREAEKTGVDGFLLFLPYTGYLSQEGLYRHFRAVAEATRLPVILYNRASSEAGFHPETLERLAQVENIVAMEESGKDILAVVEYRQCVPKDFQIYCGNDPLVLPMMALGAEGVVSPAGQIVGRRIKEMIEAFLDGKLERAKRLNQELIPFLRLLEVNTPAMVKAALELLGFKTGGLRLPLVEVQEKERNLLRSHLRRLGLL